MRRDRASLPKRAAYCWNTGTLISWPSRMPGALHCDELHLNVFVGA